MAKTLNLKPNNKSNNKNKRLFKQMTLKTTTTMTTASDVKRRPSGCGLYGNCRNMFAFLFVFHSFIYPLYYFFYTIHLCRGNCGHIFWDRANETWPPRTCLPTIRRTIMLMKTEQYQKRLAKREHRNNNNKIIGYFTCSCKWWWRWWRRKSKLIFISDYILKQHRTSRKQ